MELNLFDDVSFSAVFDRVELNRSGSYSWIGQVEGVEHSQVVLVVKERVMMGSIELPEASYEIRYESKGVHKVYEIDTSALPPGGEPIEVDSFQDSLNKTFSAKALSDDDSAEDGSIIDIMVVYTIEARESRGGTTAIETQIDLDVTETNLAYENSEVTQRLHLVHTAEIDYIESGDSETDLVRLQEDGDGFMDEVHLLRDTYGADMVSLFVADFDQGGKGYLMASVSHDFERWAFNVVNAKFPLWSLRHELGHNMGCAHHPIEDDYEGAFPFAYGYGDPDGEFYTIMCSSAVDACSGPRINYFSNPNVTYKGKPTGEADLSDCARTLNLTASTVANFRDSVPFISISTSATYMSEEVPSSTNNSLSVKLLQSKPTADGYPGLHHQWQNRQTALFNVGNCRWTLFVDNGFRLLLFTFNWQDAEEVGTSGRRPAAVWGQFCLLNEFGGGNWVRFFTGDGTAESVVGSASGLLTYQPQGLSLRSLVPFSIDTEATFVSEEVPSSVNNSFSVVFSQTEGDDGYAGLYNQVACRLIVLSIPSSAAGLGLWRMGLICCLLVSSGMMQK